MSVYFVKAKGWRCNFILKGTRYTKAWFETKRAAKQAEAEKRKEIKDPTPEIETPTDTVFLTLANRRLDYV
jgi:hypothetical protein